MPRRPKLLFTTPRPRKRLSAARRGYDRHWRRASKAWLDVHPWCAICERAGRKTLATLVDHIKAHKGDKRLFWNRRNWQSACKPCNSRKAAEEEGRWAERPFRAPGPHPTQG